MQARITIFFFRFYGIFVTNRALGGTGPAGDVTFIRNENHSRDTNSEPPAHPAPVHMGSDGSHGAAVQRQRMRPSLIAVEQAAAFSMFRVASGCAGGTGLRVLWSVLNDPGTGDTQEPQCLGRGMQDQHARVSSERPARHLRVQFHPKPCL